jgi:dTDP-4-dehydrorhamnose reductase
MSLLFGPPIVPRNGFFNLLVEAIKSGRAINLFADEWRTPLGLADAARALHALARSDFAGTIHLGGPERLSRLEMGQRLARLLKVSDASLVAGQRDSVAGAEPRPRDVSLDSSLWHARFPQFAFADFETALANMLNR